MRSIVESARERDVRDRTVIDAQASLREVDSLVEHVLVRRHSCRVFKQAAEVIGAEANLFRECVERDWAGKISVNELVKPFLLIGVLRPNPRKFQNSLNPAGNSV